MVQCFTKHYRTHNKVGTTKLVIGYSRRFTCTATIAEISAKICPSTSTVSPSPRRDFIESLKDIYLTKSGSANTTALFRTGSI
jgi:hypothetical protein